MQLVLALAVQQGIGTLHKRLGQEENKNSKHNYEGRI